MRSVRAIALLLAAMVIWPVAAAAQQAWPSRPVTMTVPFPAGGTLDLLARVIAQALTQQYHQQFIVENRVGASGSLAASAVAKSAPDGYRILVSSQAQAALNPLMFKTMMYDPQRDLVPIVLIAKSPLAVIAGPASPVNTFKELVAYAKASPGRLTVGHAGIGSMGHIALELEQQRAGIKVTSVPYRGGALVVTDLLGGQIHLASDLVSNFIRLAQAGKVRMLAVTSAKRVQDLPDVPTVQEAIQVPFEADAWFALMAPTGTPADIVQKINSVTNRYLQSAKGEELLRKHVLEAAGGTPEDAANYIRLEREKWAPVIKAAHISLH